MDVSSDPAMRGMVKRRVGLVVMTILVLFPLVFFEEASARSVVASAPTGFGETEHLTGVGSGVLVPRFQTELRTLPAASVTTRSQTLEPTSVPRTATHGNANAVVPGVLGTQSSSSISLLSGFNGLNQIQSCPCVPPDVQVAAGPNQVVEMVNLEGEVFTKGGVSNQTFSLSTFFRTGADSISDPKVLFDVPSGRWFSSLVDITINSVILGVSSTSDPTGLWSIYSINVGSFLPDQPILGVSDDKVAVAANDFSGNTFVGSQFWILNKSQMLSGSTVNFFTSGANSGVLSIHPVQSLSPTTTQYMVSDIVGRRGLSTTSLRFFSVTGVPGVSTVSVVTNDLAVSTIGTLSGSSLPGGVQPGTSATVDTADFRTQAAVWYKGAAWVTFDDACTPTGDTQLRSCIRLTKIATTGSPLVSQDFDFGTSQQYNFYPALSIDKNGNLLVEYGYSNSTVFPSLAVTGQLTTDPAGSLARPHVLKAGAAADTSTRYGDYFGAALDPADPSVVWVAGEYHNNSTGSCQSFGSCWSTFIGSASMMGFTVSHSPNALRLSAVSGASSNVTFTSFNGFAGSVSITARTSAGIAASPAQALRNITSGGSVSVVFSFSVASSLSPGNYTVMVAGSNGTLSRATNMVLTIFPDFSISLSCFCSSVTTPPGSQLRENLTLTSVNGFSGVVRLTASVLPIVSGGPTVSLNQANQTMSAGAGAVATLVIMGGNVTGVFSLTVTGACLSGSCVSPIQQHSVYLSLNVAPSGSSAGGGGGGRIMFF
jgi:hypothetical protein